MADKKQCIQMKLYIRFQVRTAMRLYVYTTSMHAVHCGRATLVYQIKSNEH